MAIIKCLLECNYIESTGIIRFILRTIFYLAVLTLQSQVLTQTYPGM